MIFVTMVVLQYLYLIKEEEFVNALSQGLLTKTKVEQHTYNNTQRRSLCARGKGVHVNGGLREGSIAEVTIVYT